MLQATWEDRDLIGGVFLLVGYEDRYLFGYERGDSCGSFDEGVRRKGGRGSGFHDWEVARSVKRQTRHGRGV